MSTRLQIIIVCLAALAAAHWLGFGSWIASKPSSKKDNSGKPAIPDDFRSEVKNSKLASLARRLFVKKLEMEPGEFTLSSGKPAESGMPKGDDQFREAVFKVAVWVNTGGAREMAPAGSLSGKKDVLLYEPDPADAEEAGDDLKLQKWPGDEPFQNPGYAKFTILENGGTIRLGDNLDSKYSLDLKLVAKEGD